MGIQAKVKPLAQTCLREIGNQKPGNIVRNSCELYESAVQYSLSIRCLTITYILYSFKLSKYRQQIERAL